MPATETAARSALSTITALLSSAGFKSYIPTGRSKRNGYGVRAPRLNGYRVSLHDYCGPVEFAKICQVLTLAGYGLRDTQGGDKFVQYGCALITLPETV